ncbi:hypothetical protein PHISCL_10965, partial [Aspergillus sclerotialis]
REHHRDESCFRGRLAVRVLGADGEVVLVDQWGQHGGTDDAEGQRDEHQSRAAFRPSLALDIDNRVCDEEHVQEAIKHRHVQGDEKDDGFEEEQLQGPEEEDGQLL